MAKDIISCDIKDAGGVNRLLNDLPSLPGVVQNLQNLLRLSDVNLTSVARIVEPDLALTAKILRLANSPFYGLSRKIRSVGEAIAILGLNSVHQLVLTASVVGTFREGSGRMKIEEFWAHSFAVGTIARNLISDRHTDLANEAFVGGILHDIGRLLFIRLNRDIFDWLYYERKAVVSLDEEISHFGVSHQQAGRLIAEKWNFPETLKRIVSGHHSNIDDGEFTLLIAAVNIGDIIAHALGIGCSGNRYAPEFYPELWKRLELNTEKCEVVIRRSLEDIFTNWEVFAD